MVDGDRFADDTNGHGTHVAGTIGEQTDNGIGLTGLAYRAKLMPVRVLGDSGRGESDDIARGIRFAAKHRADMINMSFNFDCHVAVPSRRRMRFALREPAGASCWSRLPATWLRLLSRRRPHVITVGGTTSGGCRGIYSPVSAQIDLLAPGGGIPSPPASRPPHARSFR